MFGLEKKPKNLFEFDLEKEIRGNPKRAKEVTEYVEKHISKIKEKLRHGADSADFDHLGVLLHGLVATQKVIGRIQRSK